MCLVAPYPFRLEPLEDFDPLVDFDMTGGDDVWFARPQLFFTCSLCPTGRSQDKSSHTPNSFMQRSGIPMVYERAASQLPTLYVCPVENVLGRVPLIPCYLKGNSHNTIPFSLRQHVPNGAAADSRQDSGTGSRLFEVNIWMWRYGRSFPRKVPVMDAVEMRRERVRESRRRGAATLKRRRLAAASADAAAGRPAE